MDRPSYSPAAGYEPIVRSYQKPTAELARPGWRFPREGKLWLLAAVVFWLIGWYKGVNLILLLAYMLLTLVVLNFWLARRSVRGIRAERRIPPAVHAGESRCLSIQVLSEAIRHSCYDLRCLRRLGSLQGAR